MKYYKKHNIKPPKRRYRPNIRLQIVQVKQVRPPKEGEKPIEWILFTTLPVNNLEQAQQVIQYYRYRWIIERFHFLLKSGGAKVENFNFKEASTLVNALATYSFAAMNVLKIKYFAEHQPNIPIDQVGITPIQHQVLYQYLHQHIDKRIEFKPDQIPTIKVFCIRLGLLGGFHPSKRKPIPGLKILTRAWLKLDTLIKGYELFCQRTE